MALHALRCSHPSHTVGTQPTQCQQGTGHCTALHTHRHINKQLPLACHRALHLAHACTLPSHPNAALAVAGTCWTFRWIITRQQSLESTTNTSSINTVMVGAVWPGFNDTFVLMSWNGGVTRAITRDVAAGLLRTRSVRAGVCYMYST